MVCSCPAQDLTLSGHRVVRKRTLSTLRSITKQLFSLLLNACVYVCVLRSIDPVFTKKNKINHVLHSDGGWM